MEWLFLALAVGFLGVWGYYQCRALDAEAQVKRLRAEVKLLEDDRRRWMATASECGRQAQKAWNMLRRTGRV
jgi:hypothetical protein